MKNLPNDIDRCDGSGDDTEGWREGCETCLRRTAPRPERAVMMDPPPIIVFECEYLIEPTEASVCPKCKGSGKGPAMYRPEIDNVQRDPCYTCKGTGGYPPESCSEEPSDNIQDQLAKAQNEIARLHGAIRNLKESKNGHDAQHSWKRLMTMVKKSDEIPCGKPRIGDD